MCYLDILRFGKMFSIHKLSPVLAGFLAVAKVNEQKLMCCGKPNKKLEWPLNLLDESVLVKGPSVLLFQVYCNVTKTNRI